MGAQMRVYRQRVRSVQATKKITRAMELIAASRVVKARQRVAASAPYTHALTRALSALATYSNEDHPLTTEREKVRRAGVLIIAGDRGLSGAYNSSVLKESEQLIRKLRRREYAAEWGGFSDQPTHEAAKEIAERIVKDFLTDYDEGGTEEVHVVYTRFNSMVVQEPRALRLLPIEIVDDDEEDTPDQHEVLPLYEFEPSIAQVLDAVLPNYVTARIWTCLLGAAASQLAAQQRAMKSATDNADALIKTYTRLANQARQAEITQEISEIVGGADALAAAK
jgi:F-type H+-transporting ATPase subunit gamma